MPAEDDDAVDPAFLENLAEMKKEYDAQNPKIEPEPESAMGSRRPAQPRRAARRGALAVDPDTIVPDNVKEKVKQAIFVSMGPASKQGKKLIKELEKFIHTVGDLQKFAESNSDALGDLARMQIQMQLMTVGAWKRGFNKVRALVRMRGAYKTPEEREVAEALRKAEEAAQQAKLAEEARQAKEKETEEQREAERLQREKDKAVAKRAKAAADAMNLRKALELEEWKEQRRQRLKNQAQATPDRNRFQHLSVKTDAFRHDPAASTAVTPGSLSTSPRVLEMRSQVSHDGSASRLYRSMEKPAFANTHETEVARGIVFWGEQLPVIQVQASTNRHHQERECSRSVLRQRERMRSPSLRLFSPRPMPSMPPGLLPTKMTHVFRCDPMLRRELERGQQTTPSGTARQTQALHAEAPLSPHFASRPRARCSSVRGWVVYKRQGNWRSQT